MDGAVGTIWYWKINHPEISAVSGLRQIATKDRQLRHQNRHSIGDFHRCDAARLSRRTTKGVAPKKLLYIRLRTDEIDDSINSMLHQQNFYNFITIGKKINFAWVPMKNVRLMRKRAQKQPKKEFFNKSR